MLIKHSANWIITKFGLVARWQSCSLVKTLPCKVNTVLLCCFPRIKRCEKSAESEKVLGRDFTGLCQLSTQGVRSSNCRCRWVIAVVRMCLIWRQRQQQFAVSCDLLVRAWEEQLAQKVHNPQWSNRWSEAPRNERRGTDERGWETTPRWRAGVVDVKNVWPLGFTGSFPCLVSMWLLCGFQMRQMSLWTAVCLSWNTTCNYREGEGLIIIFNGG